MSFASNLIDSVTSLNLSTDQNCLLTSSLDSTLRLIDKDTGELLNTYKGHLNTSYRCANAFSFDDGFVMSGSEPPSRFTDTPSASNTAAAGQSGEKRRNGNIGGSVIVWDLLEGHIVQKLEGKHRGVVLSVASHPKKSLAVSGSADGMLVVWKLAPTTN